MTYDEHLSRQLAEIKAKLELLKQVEAESGFGVIIEDPAVLEPIPELPFGIVETFGVCRRMEGSYFRFAQPEAISSRGSWLSREVTPYCPLGNPLSIGSERYSLPRHLTHIDGGEGIYVDPEDGDVYYIEADDYIFLYKHPDEEVELHVFADDLATFFNEFVLGEKYPLLVATVLGPGVHERRLRKGAQKGQHADSWMRLLVRAGLAS